MPELRDKENRIVMPMTDHMTRKGINRLTMISSMLGGVLIGAAACSGGGGAPKALASSSDNDILNFALNLEYLEAEFYSMAVTGKTLAQNGVATSGTGTPGGTTGGAQVTFPDSVSRGIANEIYQDEVAHVQLLQSVLGSQAIAKPAINLNGLGTQNGTIGAFLALSRAFEDTGVSAYGGAASAIQSKTVLQTAAQILAVEAYHAGSIRTLIAQMNVATTTTDSMDVLPPPSGTMYFTTSSALSVIRTTGQVINIAKPFFPSGINGNIQS